MREVFYQLKGQLTYLASSYIDILSGFKSRACTRIEIKTTTEE